DRASLRDQRRPPARDRSVLGIAPPDPAVRFPRSPEADPFERPNRRHIAGVATGDDDVDSGLVECPADDRARGLRRVAATATTGDDAVADFDRPVIVGRADEADVSDHERGLALDHHPDAVAFLA